ncbi:MAG: hypothetical protein NVS3B5_12510 [Sphingomicrobium sp.]
MIFVTAGMDMKKATKEPTYKSAEALLEKHRCPVPFHEVRTRFLGNIATPAISTAPLQLIKDLWGGELPAFDSIDEVNELLDALVQGPWNALTPHQKRSQPFRLTRMSTEPSAANQADMVSFVARNWKVSSKGCSMARTPPISPSGHKRPLPPCRAARHDGRDLRAAIPRPQGR